MSADIADNYDRQLDDMLQNWAGWCIAIANGEIGWHGVSIMSILLTSGVHTPSPGSKCPFTNEKAEKINSLINRMSRIHPGYANALATYYINRNVSPKKLAEKLNLSKSAFMHRVKSGKTWLSGALSRIEIDRKRLTVQDDSCIRLAN